MSDELIERVAKGISDDVNVRHCLGSVDWDSKGELVRAEYRACARAALEASGHAELLGFARTFLRERIDERDTEELEVIARAAIAKATCQGGK